MCRSTARFSYWGDLLPDSRIPFFNPKLEYEIDSENGGLGRDKDLFRVLDLSKNYDKSVSMFLGDDSGLPSQEDYDWMGGFCEENNSWGTGFCPQRPESKRDTPVKTNIKARAEVPTKKETKVKRRPHRRGISDRLIITAKQVHSARELCESETSYGPDTVSTVEGLFCDMETKTLYPVCEEGTNNNDICFDVDSKHLRLSNGEKVRQGRATIPKEYNTVSNWK
jgi:hypothetical protein